MKKYKTEAAYVAAIIKAELKAKFPAVKFSVRSDTFSMGDAVDVYYDRGLTAPDVKEIEAIVNKFQAGYFDGMTDSYEYTHKGTGPTAKYVMVHPQYPEAIAKEANTFIPRSASPEQYRRAYDAMIAARQCPDCIKEQTEYGVMWCIPHYDAEVDNFRAIAQTGVGINV